MNIVLRGVAKQSCLPERNQVIIVIKQLVHIDKSSNAKLDTTAIGRGFIYGV